MLSLPSGLKIFVASEPMDMRKSFDGMASIVKHYLQKDVFSGHVFVFCNKRGDRIKLLYWDRNGYCSWYKRLERGVFRFPKMDNRSYAITPNELGLLLEGIELTDRRRLKSC